jgi:hypothetical protein
LSAWALEAVNFAMADEGVAIHKDALRAPLEAGSPAGVETMFWGLDDHGRAYRLFGDADPKMRRTMRDLMRRIASGEWSGFSTDDQTRAGRIALWLDGERDAALKGLPPAPMKQVDPRPGIIAAILGWAFMIWLYWTAFHTHG